jgi:hypothetical protein
METPAAAPATHRPPKRIVIPAILLVAVTIFVVRAVVRGTWADTEPRNPESSADGVVRQLLLAPNGANKIVRLAIVVDRPIESVWTVLTDYDHLHEVMPHLAPMKASHEPGKEVIQLSGAVTSPIRDFPFDVGVVHEVHEHERLVTWNSKLDETLQVHQGAWQLRELGPAKTLVVYMIDVDVHPFPRWLVRYVLLNRFRPVMYSLRTAIEQRFPAAK